MRWRCERLGALPEAKHGQVLDAMFSLKEPKTGADGTMSWTVDVLNPGTHDDFHAKHGGDQVSVGLKGNSSLTL